MPNLNKVLLMGNITRDLETRYTPKGTAVLDVGMAINRVTKTDSGEKREEVTFVDITLWGRTAEVVAEYCKKGSPLYVEGRLTLDQWEDKATGQKRSKIKVIGETIQLLGTKGGGHASSDARADKEAESHSPRERPKPEKELEPELDENGVPY